MRYSAAIAIFVVLFLAGPVSANTLSAVGTFPADLTTREALFDATVELLKQSSFPLSVVDREQGRIESSETRYPTMNNGPDSIRPVTDTWRMSVDKAPDGSLRLSAERGSDLELERREMTQLFRNLAVKVGVGSSKVILTFDGETKPLAEWTKKNR